MSTTLQKDLAEADIRFDAAFMRSYNEQLKGFVDKSVQHIQATDVQ
jgi:hypothetical protein